MSLTKAQQKAYKIAAKLKNAGPAPISAEAKKKSAQDAAAHICQVMPGLHACAWSSLSSTTSALAPRQGLISSQLDPRTSRLT
jgi:hypothetical protein